MGASGVEMLRDGVDALLEADLCELSGLELVALLEAVEVQRRRLDAVDVALLAEIGERGVAGEFGRTSTADLLSVRLRVSPGEAKARVSRAGDLGPRRTLAGQPLIPIHPTLAAALTEGDIGGAHVDVATDALGRIPDHIAAEASPVLESVLTEAARHQHPAALRSTASLLLARLDPDGAEPDEDRQERHRGFTLTRRADGSYRPSGAWTGESGAIWNAILDVLAAPAPGEAGTPDERTPAQRRHDAMREAGLRLLRSGSLPDAGGVPVTVLVTTTAADLGDPRGVGTTDRGDVMSMRTLTRVAGGSGHFIGVDLDWHGAVMSYGRTRRLASPDQRRALAARDGGCCFPQCTRPAAWTEVHHVIRWVDGGTTDVINMCLLCSYHHRTFEAAGWMVDMINGIPYWTPPAWLDPSRTPIRNTAQHPPDITFACDHAGIDCTARSARGPTILAE